MGARDRGKQPPTEADIAELAGVSQSAVSRAFTPGASIAEETRRKILETARRVGYHPNLIARSLSTRRSNIIGLAISSLENPFYAQVVKELSERLSASGRHILLVAAAPGEAADRQEGDARAGDGDRAGERGEARFGGIRRPRPAIPRARGVRRSRPSLPRDSERAGDRAIRRARPAIPRDSERVGDRGAGYFSAIWRSRPSIRWNRKRSAGPNVEDISRRISR